MFNYRIRNINFNRNFGEVDLKKRAIKSAGITISSQVVGYIIQLIGTFLIARLVTPGDFGLVTMVTIFSLLLQNLGENGFTEYVLQKETISHIQLSNLFWINTGLNTVLTLLFVALSPILAWFYNEPRIIDISIFMGLSIIFGALPTQHLALLKRNLFFFYTSLNQLTAIFMSTVIALVLAYIGLGYLAIVVRRISHPLFIAIGGWILCPWIPSGPKKSKEIKVALKFVFNTYGNFTVSYISRNLDKLLIGRYYGISALGFYDRAYHLAMLLPNQLSSSLSSLAITALSKLRGNEESYKNYFKKILSIIALVALPISIILAFTGKDIVILLLGQQWHQAGLIFTAFAPSIGVMVIYATTGWIHLSLGRSDRWFKWGLVRVSCATIAILIGMYWGPLGVAIAYSIFMGATLLPALVYAGKPIGINFSFIIVILWKYFFAGCLSVLFCWVLFFTFPKIYSIYYILNPIIKILYLSLTSCLVYIISISFLFRGFGPFKLLIGLLRELFSKRIATKNL